MPEVREPTVLYTHCPQCQDMGVIIPEWDSRTVRALRFAWRMSHRQFAAYLGVGGGRTCDWEISSTVIRQSSMSILDAALERAPPYVQKRFVQYLQSPQLVAPPTVTLALLKEALAKVGDTAPSEWVQATKLRLAHPDRSLSEVVQLSSTRMHRATFGRYLRRLIDLAEIR